MDGVALVGFGVFQFLGRNSGRSDSRIRIPRHLRGRSVSIPRSEFWSFGPEGVVQYVFVPDVSIPRSEFWSFGPGATGSWEYCAPPFQFLGRNSGRSDVNLVVAVTDSPQVFQFLGRNSGRSDLEHADRSTYWQSFQFLGRNSGRSDEQSGSQQRRSARRFNSSVGILVVRTPRTCHGSAARQ